MRKLLFGLMVSVIVASPVICGLAGRFDGSGFRDHRRARWQAVSGPPQAGA